MSRVAQRSSTAALTVLANDVVACRRCERLVAFREEIGRTRRRAYREQEYWSKAVPGFGDPEARLLLVGLAPGAHGSNRTGRMFTGDRSGDFLYPALYETGFASQPNSVDRSDGLELHDAYITAAVRCAPPDNKPEPDEVVACRPYLIRELALLKNIQVVLALGAIGMSAYLSVLQQQGLIKSRTRFQFAHGALYQTHDGGPALLASYHPSQQNTSTKRLTAQMFRDIFLRARSLFT
ncbi:MAG TPA: uracil-DNA glycosylase [Bryobacteraceae bacterium]|jgi:uracil-DNA glycosylase family 4|nr:uracil-DNA glycosylase [Bryobacteraceae bacterium]